MTGTLLDDARMTEDYGVVWLPGHVTDRDERRRMVARFANEIGDDPVEHEFMEQVRIARSAVFVWMRPWEHRASGWSVECRASESGALPYMRLCWGG